MPLKEHKKNLPCSFYCLCVYLLLLFFKEERKCSRYSVAGQACNPPFTMVGSKCLYVESDLRLSWPEARDFCKGLASDGGGADMASFPSCDNFVAFSRYLEFNGTYKKKISWWVNEDIGVLTWVFTYTYVCNIIRYAYKHIHGQIPDARKQSMGSHEPHIIMISFNPSSQYQRNVGGRALGLHAQHVAVDKRRGPADGRAFLVLQWGLRWNTGLRQHLYGLLQPAGRRSLRASVVCTINISYI